MCDTKGKQIEESDETVNFLDAAQGLKCWKQCMIHKGKAFAGYVKIRVETANGTDVKSDSLFDRYGMFLSEQFGAESILQNGFFSYLQAEQKSCKMSLTQNEV